MEKIIIEVDDMMIKIDSSLLDSPEFDVDFGNFLIQFITDNRTPHIQNAVDGYGINRRTDFIGKEVIIYTKQNKP